jgi:hypothetical protein
MGVAREILQRSRQREGRLPGARGGDGQEVAAGMVLEQVERLLLPAAQA